MKKYTIENIIDQKCKHITCEYWGQSGCMLPGRCIYAPDDYENITVEIEENL